MILNLTQHQATEDQARAGVVDLPATQREHLRALLTFDEPPGPAEIGARARALAMLAALHASPDDRTDDDGLLPPGDPGGLALQAMVGGAAYLMPALERELLTHGIEPLHAFTRREVLETHNADGTVSKQAIFRFAGWVRTHDAP